MKCRKCGLECDGGVCAGCGKVAGGRLLGFRSGMLFKKVISVAYLIFAGLLSAMFLLTIESYLDRLMAIEVVISLYIPYVLLSEFKLRDYLPLFKSRKPLHSFIGLVLVYLLINIIFTLLHPDFNLI